MNQGMRLLTIVIALSTVFVVGCETEQVRKERQAQQQREVQLAKQAAAATATTQALQSHQGEVENARQTAFELGKATGRAEALSEVDQLKERAFLRGKEMGTAAGEKTGYDKGLKTGEEVGYSKAAAEEFKKGIEQGELFGKIEGRREAAEEAEAKLEIAVEKAKLATIEQHQQKWVDEGKEYQRQQDFFAVASVAICISASFVGVLAFLLTRRLPGSAVALERQRQEDLKRESAWIDRFDRMEQDRARLFQLLERSRRDDGGQQQLLGTVGV